MAELDDLADAIKRVPLCPYCGHPMHAQHVKLRLAIGWKLVELRFGCIKNFTGAPHTFLVTAKNVFEWEKHVNKLKFEEPTCR